MPSAGVSSREIWSLTWPQTLMMLAQFLVGFTDVVVAGAISPQVQAAFGILMQCHFFFLIFGFALINGGVAAMSQALGAGLSRRAERYIGLIAKIAGLVCLLVVAFGYLFRRELFSLLRTPEEILPLTLDLWNLALALLPVSYLNIVAGGVFRARKNVRIPFLSSLAVCILNLFGDLGLGLGFFSLPNMGGRGLFIASIIAVAAGGLFTLGALARQGIVSRRCFASRRWEVRALPYILKVALPSGGSQALWQSGYLVLFLITATLPAGQIAAVAGLTAGMRVEAILCLPAWACGMTAAILVGHCLGAGDRSGARRVGLRITGAAVLAMSLFALLLLPWVREICAFVAPDPEVQAVAAAYLYFNIAAIPFAVTGMNTNGIFTGAGATVYSLSVFASGMWLVRLPLAWYMGHHLWGDASGVFLAMLVSQAIQASLAFYLFLRRDWQRFASTAGRWKKRIP
jgi:MATE family multidrug resistance protein